MTRLIRLTIAGVVLPGLLLGTSRVTPAAAGSLVAKAKVRNVSVAVDQQVAVTAKPGTDVVAVVTAAADIVLIDPRGRVRVSGRRVSASTSFCVKSGGCQCPPGFQYQGPPLVAFESGKLAVALHGGKRGAKATFVGYSVRELCSEDTCLIGTWSADLSGYLASAGLQVLSVSGIETYTFSRDNGAEASANNYTFRAINVKDGGALTFVINGTASANWDTPKKGTLRVSSVSGGWDVFIVELVQNDPASGPIAFLGPWANQPTGAYQCSPDGRTVQYSPDPRFAPIVLTKIP
jgi:hypothetical protein